GSIQTVKQGRVWSRCSRNALSDRCALSRLIAHAIGHLVAICSQRSGRRPHEAEKWSAAWRLKRIALGSAQSSGCFPRVLLDAEKSAERLIGLVPSQWADLADLLAAEGDHQGSRG